MNTDDQLKAALKRDAALREAIKLDEIEAPKMPSDLNARLMQRVAQEQAHVATRTRRLWPWIAGACAVAFIAVFLTPPKGVVTEGAEKTELVASAITTESAELVAKAITTESAENAETTESPAPEAAPEAAPAPVAAPAVKVAAKAPKAAPAAPKAAPVATPAPQRVETAAQHMLAATTTPAAATTAQPAVAQQKKSVLSERDIPITRPENYKYTPEELAQLKKQAAEAYLKWVELEMEISRNNLEQALK